MGLTTTAAVLALTAGALVPAMATAETPKATCADVSIDGGAVGVAPTLTVVPGDSGVRHLSVKNAGWSAADASLVVTAKIAGTPQQFHRDLQVGVNKNAVSAEQAASTPITMSAAGIEPGATVPFDITWSYPSTATEIPVNAGAVTLSIEVNLTGDSANKEIVSCSVKPPLKINPLSLASDNHFVDVDGDGRPGAGDTISYTYTVTNTVPQEITNIKVTSLMEPGVRTNTPAVTTTPSPTSTAVALAQSASVQDASTPTADPSATPIRTDLPTTCKDTKLTHEGDKTTCTSASYTLTAADEAAGGVTNIVYASADGVDGAALKSDQQANPYAAAPVAATPSQSPVPVPSFTPGPMPIQEPAPTPGKGFAIIDAGAAALAGLSAPALWGGTGLVLLGSGGVLAWRRRRNMD